MEAIILSLWFFVMQKHFCETPVSTLPSSSYGSRLSRSRCFPPWAKWRATCSSASTRPPCTKSWRTRLAGCATYALSCRSSSWWRATAAEQSAFWTPKSACSSARVRRLCIGGFAYSKLLCKLLRTSLPHKPISFLSQFGIPNKEKHLELVSGTVKLFSCTKRITPPPAKCFFFSAFCGDTRGPSTASSYQRPCWLIENLQGVTTHVPCMSSITRHLVSSPVKISPF